MEEARAGIAARRDQEWDSMLRYLEGSSDRYARALLPVARLARQHLRLGLLFPFQSLNRLCFSRCFPGPYTNDCPCIGVDHLGRFGVSAFPYPLNWDGEDPPYIGDARDAQHAIELASAGLPPNADQVWLTTSLPGDIGAP